MIQITGEASEYATELDASRKLNEWLNERPAKRHPSK